jgi:hypothetical protein
MPTKTTCEHDNILYNLVHIVYALFIHNYGKILDCYRGLELVQICFILNT